MPAATFPTPVLSRRILFTEGGKGGVGKTVFMTGLVEWCDARRLSYSLLDLDTENKVRGSLTHYFRNKAVKVNMHTPESLNLFEHMQNAPLVIADMGAGSGQVAHRWFDSTYNSAREKGVAFTAIGVVTPDPASVESVLSWAHVLQHRVDYLVVKNALTPSADFSFWERGTQASQFRKVFQPEEISMEYRVPQFENLVRRFGVTVGQTAERKFGIPELQQASVVLRAQAYRRHLFAELDRVKDVVFDEQPRE